MATRKISPTNQSSSIDTDFLKGIRSSIGQEEPTTSIAVTKKANGVRTYLNIEIDNEEKDKIKGFCAANGIKLKEYACLAMLHVISEAEQGIVKVGRHGISTISV